MERLKHEIFKRKGLVSPMNKLNELREKKLDNKGFSLVELIIVIAIMAVLIGVLAPQYLRYVETSRYQSDASMIDNVKNAIEVAISSNEDVYTNMPTTATTVIDLTTFNSASDSIGWAELNTEVTKTIKPADIKLTSKTLTKSGATAKIDIDATGDLVVTIDPAP